MSDSIYASFLAAQFALARGFEAANPGLIDLLPIPPCRWMARFSCKGLVRMPGGPIDEATAFEVGIVLPPDYCRRIDPRVVTLFTPDVWHPNVCGPLMCLGQLAPATPLPDLLVQIYEVLVYLNYTPQHGLNPEACQWARNNAHRFPLERRPIRMPRRAIPASCPLLP